jgi:hypothetical protein
MGSITIGSNYTSILGREDQRDALMGLIAQCSGRKFGDEPINVAPSIKKKKRKEKQQLTARGHP